MAATDVCNAAVTVAPVIVFAKFVTHRSRRAHAAGAGAAVRWGHLLCVLLSGASLFAAILGLAWSAHVEALAWFAAGTLALSFLILLWDGLRDDLRDR
jgi:hypothetical protein